MNKFLTQSLIVSFLLAGSTMHAQVAINATGAPGNPSAVLDISSTTKGMLSPRMTAAERIAITNPAEGLMVFQVTSPIGYWYYDSNVGGWTSVFQGSEPWTLKGNTGTNPTNQFLGTTNNQALVFGTNGAEAARFANNGRLQLGPTAPTEIMQVEGGMKLTGSSVANTEGAIRWNATAGVHEGNVDGTANGWYPLENVMNDEDPHNYAVTPPFGCSIPPGGYVQIGAGTGQTQGTIETAFGTLWEDKKTQYMWLAADLAAASMCPNEDITGLAFETTSFGGTAYPQRNAQLGMLLTSSADLSAGFESGTTIIWNGPAAGFVPTSGAFNQITFDTPYQWSGAANLVVEYSFDNCDWGSNINLTSDATSYAALYGMFCDACGGGGANTCSAGAQCPYETHSTTCAGAGSGAIGGNNFDNSTNTVTCDGCGGWQGGQGPANKRPRVRFYTLSGTQPPPVATASQMMWYQGGLMIGDATWATQTVGGPLPANPAYFRGPGTISAENSVWAGGTQLNDYVFDIYFDGEPRYEDTSRIGNYEHMPIVEMVNYVERERHLPTIEGREAWTNNGSFSVDQLNNQMWVTVEEQALYIKELNERMKMLQEYLIEKKLAE